MAGFERGDDAFGTAEELEGFQCFLVGNRGVFDALHILEPGVFGADAGIVEACADRMTLGNLAVVVLQQIGFVAVEHAGEAAEEAGRVFVAVEAVTCRLHAEHLHVGIVEEGVEQAERVRAAADRRDQQIGQAADPVLHLLPRLAADHALEVAHQFGVGVRPGGGADDVESVVHIRDPVAQPFVHRVFQCAAPAGHGDDFRAEQLHAEDIGRLAPHVLCAHVDHAGQAEACANRCGGDPVLARPGFRDDARLAHADR